MNCRFIKSVMTIFLGFLILSTPVFGSYNYNMIQNEMINQSNHRNYIHTVQKGETVYSIAKMYDINIRDIYALNPNATAGLKVGENLIIPDNSKPRTYTVKAKETLYSIAKYFGVSVDDIVALNPSLKTTPLYEGETLRIPTQVLKSNSSKDQFIEHKVENKETIYGIAKQFNITPEVLIEFNPDIKDGLKEGSKILIPLVSSPVQYKSTLYDINAINIGIVLPILNKSEAQSARFLEYYEGFLLALNEMKAKGFSANVYVFDIGSQTGTTKLKSLLETAEMKNLDLIIGGVSPEQIQIISDFSKKEGIKYAIPFPTKTDVAISNDLAYQVNGTVSLLNDLASKAFVSRFAGANTIFVTSNTQADKKEFLANLSKIGIVEKNVVLSQNLKSSLSKAIDYNKKNVIVLSSGSSTMLKQVVTSLNQISSEHPNLNVSLFGYTEWQTYPQFFKDFNNYDTYIYTPFYALDDDYKVKQFLANYNKWYNKSLINTYPKYGMLGYDTGMYFLTALQKFGKNFQTNDNSVRTLQTPFVFVKPNPKGGYINTGFYFIHFKTDGSIEKIDNTK